MTNEIPRYLTTQEAADYMGIPKQTLLQWRCLGKPSPRAARVGKHLRFDVADLVAFMESMKETA
ncbi:helix-turn-helix domain-containing protein [Cumulibacter soli]|uniref:helix-turn-helix domain-containing protein n=1 Tax=Cumulibacter soli TaxID=2546344 RepID=UPI0010679AD9|nr:helix-turn-helix domain-containing protein [Cumulibacter soli]